MSYRLEFAPDVRKQLKKIDKYQATLLTRWLYRNIDGTNTPKKHGKVLSVNRAEQWRYRIGNYRVIVEIEDERLVVIAIQIGNRRSIYDR
ncbi:type II toxin-antitoxin system RelE/ParE family toxin [Enterococcus faecalis]